MTPEQQREYLVEFNEYLRLASEYNAWQMKAKENLFMNIGPKLHTMGKDAYHYGKEITFANLIKELATPWRLDGNNYHDRKEQFCSTIITKTLYDSLIEDVEKDSSNK